MEQFILGIYRFLEGYSYFIIAYFVLINSAYLMLIGISFFHIRRQIREKDVFGLHGLFASNLYNPISILAPAFNEEATVVASVKSLLQLRFPNYEVIVINDGSKDRTMDVLISSFQLERVKRYVPLVLKHKPIKGIYRSKLYPELIVVDKENGRKADALNAGINVSRNDLFCAIDADCVLEPDVLQNMLRCFIEDESTIAVGGIVRVANDCVIEGNEIKEIRIPKSHLARIQVVEYLRAFLFGRVGWDYLDSLLIISGAFGIFDRNAVLKVGGYLHDTVGEDMELVVRLHRYHRENKIPYRVRFLPEPVCWTEVPEDRGVLSRQRNRWQRGLADTLWRHKKMLFNPKYGRLGFFAMPFFFFFELLGPVIELAGYIIIIIAFLIGAVNIQFALLFLAAAVLLGMVLSVSSVLCEEFTYRRYPKLRDVLLMTLYAFIENFGFRQMHSWWRFKGIIDFLKGNKEWGAMTRKGLGSQAALANLKVEDKSEGAIVSEGVRFDDQEKYIGDSTSNFGDYLENVTERKKNLEFEDAPFEPDPSLFADEPTKTSTGFKFAAAVFIVAFLGLSFWFKYDLIVGLLNPQQDPVTVLVEVEREETEADVTFSEESDTITEDVPEIIWTELEPYFFIAYHSFSSQRRGFYAHQFRERYTDEGYNVSILPRTGEANQIIWMAGVGMFTSFFEANRYVETMVDRPSQFSIERAGNQDMRVFEEATDLNPGLPINEIILGTYETRGGQARAARFWRNAGFTQVRVTDSEPYLVLTGGYNGRFEANLMAELIALRTGQTVTVRRRP